MKTHGHLTRAVGSFAILMASLLLANSSAYAQDVQSRPMRIITPYPSGTGPDTVARMIGEKIAKATNHPVVVDPRPGGNGFIAAEAVRKAPPDGSELLLVDNGHVAINPSLFSKLPYDVERDFAPVSLVFRTPFFVVVSSSSPFQSVADLISAAKAKPGEISYGTPFVGSPSHLGSAALEFQTGTRMIHVPFKETSQLWTSVATGEVTWSLGTVASTRAFVQSGRLKLLAIAATQRLPTQPNIPTVSELGGPAGYEVNAWVALLAPRATPPQVVQRLNGEVVKALQDKEIVERFSALGFESTPSTPAQLADLIRVDTRKYAEVVKRVGAKAD